MNAEAHIGTSGFYYEHWRGILYPEGIPKNRWFEYFSREFDTVEMNSTFYHLPRSKTVEGWDSRSPDDFLFSFKASRSISHYKRLRGVKEDLYLFLHLLKPLRHKIAAILIQLPPSLHKDAELLADFFPILPPRWRFVLEFRHESWYDEEIYALLRQYGVAYCWHDFGRKETPILSTTDFCYIRLHGPSGHYQGSYEDTVLWKWDRRIRQEVDRGHEVFVYFNNDMEGNAIRDAQRLKSFLEMGNS